MIKKQVKKIKKEGLEVDLNKNKNIIGSRVLRSDNIKNKLRRKNKIE